MDPEISLLWTLLTLRRKPSPKAVSFILLALTASLAMTASAKAVFAKDAGFIRHQLILAMKDLAVDTVMTPTLCQPRNTGAKCGRDAVTRLATRQSNRLSPIKNRPPPTMWVTLESTPPDYPMTGNRHSVLHARSRDSPTSVPHVNLVLSQFAKFVREAVRSHARGIRVPRTISYPPGWPPNLSPMEFSGVVANCLLSKVLFKRVPLEL